MQFRTAVGNSAGKHSVPYCWSVEITVIPRLTIIIRSGITFVSRHSNVNKQVGLVALPYVMWSAHFFVTHLQTEKISSWNGPTVHVCCFMLARASTKTFVSRVRKTAKKIFVSHNSRVTRLPRYHCIIRKDDLNSSSHTLKTRETTLTVTQRWVI